MLNALKTHLPTYQITSITTQNFPQAYEIYQSNQAFFQLVQGADTTPEKSIQDITALPPHCTPDQKLYIRISQNSQPLAVLDIIEKFPTPDCFWIGLLLVHRQHQGSNIGSQITQAILSAAKTAGYKKAQLGVVDSNKKGVHFWQKLGFIKTGQSDDVIIMARDI